MKRIVLCLMAVFIVILLNCKSGDEYLKIHPNKNLTIENMNFVDQFGRHVILSGINLVDKSVDGDYLEEFDSELFKKYKEWGFNCIRLGVVWAGVEPEPGVYNEQYLAQLDEWIMRAQANNIMVVLDMHQDLYSMKYSDGAADWATLDEGKPHVTGQIWDDAYFLSPAVQTAFDNFWANKKTSDGIGVQDHYINMWKHLAKRYKNQPNVIGYDIMNEPFNGSEAQRIMAATFTNFAEVILEHEGAQAGSLEEIQQKWLDENQRLEYYKYIDSAEEYKNLVEPIIAFNHAFESGVLQTMYQNVANAIRQHDQEKILFLEHGYYANIGLTTAITPVKMSDGKNDPLVAYAAHCYDLLTDTKNVSIINDTRNDHIYKTIFESGKRMNRPVWVGEWGAFYNVDKVKGVKSAQNLIDLIEKYNLSHAYWAYYNGLENETYFQKALVRAYPLYLSGDLVEYDHDFSNNIFHCKWQEKKAVKAPTVIYIPGKIDVSEIVSVPQIKEKRMDMVTTEKYTYLVIKSGKKDQLQSIKIELE